MHRYLISQSLGRTIAHVVLDEFGTGVVHLTLADAACHVCQFQFLVDSVAALAGPDADDIGERAIRHAMAQAQRMQMTVGGDAPVMFLDLALSPWLGDLTTVPYGGATVGVEARRAVMAASMPTAGPERRTDQAFAQLIDRAIEAQRFYGPAAAAMILADAGIPDHISLRVFSSAPFRRKS